MEEPITFPTEHAGFAADFTTVKDLGKGRFGEVSLCEHRATGKRFAIKRTKFGSGGQPDEEKVEVEAEALERLQHENVIRHYTAFSHHDPVHGPIFCIMMEFADRGDLASLLSER